MIVKNNIHANVNTNVDAVLGYTRNVVMTMHEYDCGLSKCNSYNA